MSTEKSASGQGINRRSFLKSGAIGLAAAASLNMKAMPEQHWGTALIAFPQSDDLVLINLNSGKTIHNFENFDATHAVVAIEKHNRFLVQGVYKSQAVVRVIDVTPGTDQWTHVKDIPLKGGRPLHWQVRADQSEVMFNCIEDGLIHVLNSKSLKLESYKGGGSHSNMAFFGERIITTDHYRGDSKLNVIDRKTGSLISSTPVGAGAHGLGVCHKTGQAFVWTWDGLQQVQVSGKETGKLLKTITPFDDDQRCWFSWTPEGGRYSHDTAWASGDEYSDYLMVIDMEKGKLEKCPTTGHKPVYLQVSLDGKIGLCSLAGESAVGLINIPENKFLGTIPCGESDGRFFDRDFGFHKNRQQALCTNTAEKSISLLDLKTKKEVRQIKLPGKPGWAKMLS